MSEAAIKVVIPISARDIRNLVIINNRLQGRTDKVDEQRLFAALGMEYSLDDIVEFETPKDKEEYGRFLLGVTAAIVSQLKLVKQNG